MTTREGLPGEVDASWWETWNKLHQLWFEDNEVLPLTEEKLTEKCKEIETALENEVTETRVKQIELDKTIDQYRALHKDRQLLVQQWKP